MPAMSFLIFCEIYICSKRPVVFSNTVISCSNYSNTSIYSGQHSHPIFILSTHFIFKYLIIRWVSQIIAVQLRLYNWDPGVKADSTVVLCDVIRSTHMHMAPNPKDAYQRSDPVIRGPDTSLRGLTQLQVVSTTGMIDSASVRHLRTEWTVWRHSVVCVFNSNIHHLGRTLSGKFQIKAWREKMFAGESLQTVGT